MARFGAAARRPVTITVSDVALRDILPLRERYRKEMSCQIVHDSWHERGFTKSYLISVDGEVVGYGSVGGAGDEPRDVVKEFWLEPTGRVMPNALFSELVRASGARRIAAQTNDRVLTQMLLDSVETIERDHVLFEDGVTTHHVLPGAAFRPIEEEERDRVFPHEVEPVGDWVIELDGEVVATGGLMFHYNAPFSDVYMEVAAPSRRRGIGAYLVQELKRVSHDIGKTPAARTSTDNVASRRALQRAGMIPCAWILTGAIGK
jgi:GNAT superfamily N-acetyltransferase